MKERMVKQKSKKKKKKKNVINRWSFTIHASFVGTRVEHVQFTTGATRRPGIATQRFSFANQWGNCGAARNCPQNSNCNAASSGSGSGNTTVSANDTVGSGTTTVSADNTVGPDATSASAWIANNSRGICFCSRQ